MTVAKTGIDVIKQQPLLLNVSHARVTVTPEQFDRLCIDNPDLRLELMADGELRVMAPAGGERSAKNFDLALEVGIWNRKTGLGRSFDLIIISTKQLEFVLSTPLAWEEPQLSELNHLGQATLGLLPRAALPQAH